MTSAEYAALLARLGEVDRKLEKMNALLALFVNNTAAAPKKKGGDGGPPMKKIDGKWHAFHEGTGWVRTWSRDKFPPRDE